MPKLTRAHFEWLARDIAPLVTDKDRFIKEVQSFNTNSRFCSYRFRNAVEDAWADAQAEECGPELYKQADY